MCKFLCNFGHAMYNSGQILSSEATPSFVGTPNFKHLYISDDCTVYTNH